MVLLNIFGSIAESFTNNLIVEERYRMILDGLQVTLVITLCAAVLGTLLGERRKQGIEDLEGKPFRRPAAWGDAALALKLGTAMQIRDEGGRPWDYTFCPQADHYMKAHLFGDIYASDQLTPAGRELVTVAALSAMEGVEPQFEGHKECAVHMGNTREQVEQLCRWLSDNIN